MAMSIDQFIESYIDFGAYDGLFPEEQVVLLKLAHAFYLDYATKTPLSGLSLSLEIEVILGTSGGTKIYFEPDTSGIATSVITIPSGPDGATPIPVGDLPGHMNKTFLTYDVKTVLVHEVNHLILALLGISPSNKWGPNKCK